MPSWQRRVARPVSPNGATRREPAPVNDANSPLCAVARGRESQKTPVLLLHGFTGSSEAWGERILGRLSAGRRVIAVDLPGHGSSLISTDPAQIDFSAVVALLAEALDAHGIPVADWIGYSMGGRIALAAAIQRPDRVRRLVLESSSPGLETETERALRRTEDEGLADRIEELGIDWFVDHWMELPLFASQRTLNAQSRDEARLRRLRNDPKHLAAALRALGAGSQPSLWSELTELRKDLLLVTGEADVKYGRLADRIADSIPTAAHVCVPGVGHAVHVEAPDAWLEAVVGFLDLTFCVWP